MQVGARLLVVDARGNAPPPATQRDAMPDEYPGAGRPARRTWPRRPDNPERLAAFTRTANARRCAKEGREAPAADPASPLYRGRRGFGHRR